MIETMAVTVTVIEILTEIVTVAVIVTKTMT